MGTSEGRGGGCGRGKRRRRRLAPLGGEERGIQGERRGVQGGAGVVVALEWGRGEKQEVEERGGARLRARRPASAYWQRWKTVGGWAGPQPQCWAKWAAQVS